MIKVLTHAQHYSYWPGKGQRETFSNICVAVEEENAEHFYTTRVISVSNAKVVVHSLDHKHWITSTHHTILSDRLNSTTGMRKYFSERNELAQVVFELTILCSLDRVLYQLSLMYMYNIHVLKAGHLRHP